MFRVSYTFRDDVKKTFRSRKTYWALTRRQLKHLLEKEEVIDTKPITLVRYRVPAWGIPDYIVFKEDAIRSPVDDLEEVSCVEFLLERGAKKTSWRWQSSSTLPSPTPDDTRIRDAKSTGYDVECENASKHADHIVTSSALLPAIARSLPYNTVFLRLIDSGNDAVIEAATDSFLSSCVASSRGSFPNEHNASQGRTRLLAFATKHGLASEAQNLLSSLSELLARAVASALVLGSKSTASVASPGATSDLGGPVGDGGGYSDTHLLRHSIPGIYLPFPFRDDESGTRVATATHAFGNYFSLTIESSRPAAVLTGDAFAALVQGTHSNMEGLQGSMVPLHCQDPASASFSCDIASIPASILHFVGGFDFPPAGKSTPIRVAGEPLPARVSPRVVFNISGTRITATEYAFILVALSAQHHVNNIIDKGRVRRSSTVSSLRTTHQRLSPQMPRRMPSLDSMKMKSPRTARMQRSLPLSSFSSSNHLEPHPPGNPSTNPISPLSSRAMPVTKLTYAGSSKSPLPRPVSGADVIQVIIADDFPTHIRIMERVCQNLGCTQIQCVSDGEKVLDTLRRLNSTRKNRNVLIFMDLRMPAFPGKLATARIRGSPSEFGTPHIVGMTSQIFASEGSSCLKVGMNAFLLKPVSAESVRSIIEKFIESAPQV